MIQAPLTKQDGSRGDAGNSFPPTFWKVRVDRQKEVQVKISRTGFLLFLEGQGFGKVHRGSSYQLVQVKDKVIREVTANLLKDFVRKYVEEYPLGEHEEDEAVREEILEKVIKGAATFFGESNLTLLRPVTPSYKRDTANEGFHYYRNCFVLVTAGGLRAFPYALLDGVIWERQIRDRDFRLAEGAESCDFARLVRNVCAGDGARVQSLDSTLGYLLHSHKDESLSKAVVFADEQIAQPGEANGGTCKSLVAGALVHFRSTWYRGKGYSTDRSFAYEGITPDTQLCLLDDVAAGFNFESMFTNVTNSLTVEGKGRPAFTIPYREAPKWLITTNYVLGGQGTSFERRVHVIEFSDHYLRHPRPREEFGRVLFTGWDESEWARMDTYMLRCQQLFLKEGLREVRVNYAERALLQQTSEEFVAFMEGLRPGQAYELHELKEEFCRRQTDFQLDRSFTNRKFFGWVRLYFRTRKIACLGDGNPNVKNRPFEVSNDKHFLEMIPS